jgi:toxin YoeB
MTVNKLWHDKAWEEYMSWQNEDRKTLRRINILLKSIERNRYDGIGKPEPLKGNLSDWWSVRIDDANRLIFKIKNEIMEILSCKGHYE